MKRIVSKPLFWIILASFLPILSLFHPGMPILHDGQDHVARFANFYAALKEGVIIPRWAANLNWGYGHPILMFLYPLPEYIASIFHVVGFSLVDSIKIVFGLSFIASAVTMFIWMNAAFGPEAGVIGALLYAFAPYRFVDMHVRGDLGELVAFVFPPLITYFVLLLSRAKQVRDRYIFGLGLAVSTAALILSHNAMALMFLPVIGLYGLYLLLFESKDKIPFIISGVAAVAIGFGLSGFFWMPALLEGKFTLREIVTAGEALQRFVPAQMFLYSPWNYGGTDTLTKSVGLAQWIGVIGAIVILVKTKINKSKIFVACSLITLAASLFIMTQASAPIWRASKLLQDFQFPWRFLSLSAFLVAVLGGLSLPYMVHMITKKDTKHANIFFIVICIGIVGITYMMWVPKGYQMHGDSFYTGIYPSTTDTGESSPVWSVRFMEHMPVSPLDVVDGDASVTVGKRTTTMHEYTVTVRKPTLMMENTLYFPGWMIYINGLPTAIEWQNPTYRGIMTFRMTPGVSQNVRVVFGDTRVRRVSDWLSLISVIIAIMTGIGVRIWRKK